MVIVVRIVVSIIKEDELGCYYNNLGEVNRVLIVNWLDFEGFFYMLIVECENLRF